MREERSRARDAENRAELVERAVMEERQRAQEAERQPDWETSQADKRASVIHFTCENDNDSRNKMSTGTLTTYCIQGSDIKIQHFAQ